MPTVNSSDLDTDPLKCMEVWGGNGANERHFVRPGIDLWTKTKLADTESQGAEDLYLLSSCASGRITRLLLAEVCSSSASFVGLAEKLRQVMKENINKISHRRLVEEVSRDLRDSSEDACYASLMIGSYFSMTKTLSLCNAGHPPPLLYQRKNSEWSLLRKRDESACSSVGLPGVIDVAEYHCFETKLETGDMVFSYSNSLTECLNESGRTIGAYGILDRIQQLDLTQPSQLIGKLIEQVRQEHPDNLLADDVTAILCRATTTKVSWWDSLLAPIRFLQGAADRTNII